jgi:hypothetical protein
MNNKITIIERPTESEDNNWNLAERDLLKYYCDRHGEEILVFEVYGWYVKAITFSGRVLIAKIADTCGFAFTEKFKKYLYMNEVINGKEKRIKKSEY